MFFYCIFNIEKYLKLRYVEINIVMIKKQQYICDC